MAKKDRVKKQRQKDVIVRPPIVTLMGHVDHGKTSILDTIRKSQITSGESGGITQHIGAYTLDKKGKRIVFIDTPGHEAFTQMRARGGMAADIIILVVAADDGVMPQTKEAVMHAKAANVPIIVAINKVDLPTADVVRVKQQLAENEIITEDLGGDIVSVEVSATKGKGINDLIDLIHLVAEMNKERLEVEPDSQLEMIIIESSKSSKKGVIVSGVVKTGTLNVRDEISANGNQCRVKAIIKFPNKRIKAAMAGDVVEILGFTHVPPVGSVIRKIGNNKEIVVPAEDIKEKPIISTDEVGNKILNLIIRADALGTKEAIFSSIEKLKVDDAVPRVVLAGVGDVKESDVLLASASKAIIMAFKVKVPSSIDDLAKQHRVIIREHEIIYKLLEEIGDALQGVIEIEESKIKGRGLVIKTFTLPKSGMKVAGTLVEAGKFRVNSRIGVYRDDEETPLYVARIKSIHVGNKSVDMAVKGDEVGLIFKPNLEDISLDDRIEAL